MFKLGVATFLTLLSTQVLVTSAQFPDLLFTCPAWGCSSRGTFALPTPVPESRPQVRWNWTEDLVVYGNPDFQSRGCSSSLTTVACPTSQGYITLDVKTGRQRLSDKKGNNPYLPIVDYYGNILQSDDEKLTFVTGKGSVESKTVLTQYKPQYGPVISYQHTVLLTSSNTSTPQINTFGELGSKFASTSLKDKVNNVSGTFVACGHPLIDFERAYVITRFIPDSSTDFRANKADGMHRLYTIDLSGNQTDNVIAWHFDLPGLSGEMYNRKTYSNKNHEKLTDGYSESFLAFFNKTIYINYAKVPMSNLKNTPIHDPTPSILCAIQDLGNQPKLIYKTMSKYGPISLYSITDSWTNITATGSRTIWVKDMSRSVDIAGYSAATGTQAAVVKFNDIPGLENLGQITSYVGVARQAQHTDRDVLVFGTQDDDGQAYLVALEAGLPPVKPRLLWYLNMSGPRRVPGRPSQWVIGGQIASVAFSPHRDRDDEMQYGLAVSVVEGLAWVNASQVYVRLVV